MKYNYFIPTRIIFGENCIKENSDYMAIGHKALIVTGKSSRNNGSLDDVISALESHGIKYEIFDGVKSNPDLENVSKGADVARRADADFVIGIGGGSPLDASKAIAVLAANPMMDAEELFSKTFKNKPLPIIAVPTTAGTGSEVTPYSILTYDRIGSKKNFASPYIFPHVAFLDARYTINLPYSVTVDTMLDALSHLIEGYLSVKYGDFYFWMVEKGLKGFSESYKSVMDGQLDLKTREVLLNSSLLGGMLIAHTGTSIVHAMGYSLTYYKDIPHGRANGMLLADYLKFNCETDGDKVEHILSLLNIGNIEGLRSIVSGLLQRVDKRPDISESEMAHYASIAIKAPNIANNKKVVTQEDLFKIYKSSLMGI